MVFRVTVVRKDHFLKARNFVGCIVHGMILIYNISYCNLYIDNYIRTSRANPSILDNILVDSYGTQTPLNQLANISAPEANMLTVQV